MASRGLTALRWGKASLGLLSPAAALTFLTSMASQHPQFLTGCPRCTPRSQPHH